MSNTRLEYTAGIPAVFPFDYSQIVGVERAARDEDQPALPDTGSVVLCLGDVLVVADDFDLEGHLGEYAHLTLLDPVEPKKAEPNPDKGAGKTPSKASKAPDAPVDAEPVNQPDAAQEPQNVTDSGETVAETPEGEPGELGDVLDSIATQHIPTGMEGTFRNAGLIP